MVKFFYRFFIYLGIVFLISFSYLSIIGVETKTFNSQIKKNLKNINKDLDTELNDVKILIDPFKFQLNIKTLGPKILFKDQKILLESIKSKIPIVSLIRKEFSSTNLNISTKSLKIKDLISFLRAYDNKFQYFLLDKTVKNGFLIADININFDEKGSIKKDFIVNGLLKEGKIDLLNNQELDKINFIFEVKNNSINLEDLSFLLGKINFFSNNILIDNNKNNYSVKGKINNKKISLTKKELNKISKILFNDQTFDMLDFQSENIFSFEVDKKLKFKNLKIKSDLQIFELKKNYDLELKRIFPNSSNELIFKDHKINLEYKKNNMSISGKGSLLIQKEFDEIEYDIKKNKDDIKFNSKFIFTKNDLIIDTLNFIKDKNSEAILNFEGNLSKNNDLSFDKIELQNNENIIRIKNLSLNKDFKFLNLESANFDFTDKQKFRNQFYLKRKKNDYKINGKILNASKIIDNLIQNDDNKNNFIINDSKISIELKKVYLDNDHFVRDLQGYFKISDDKIVSAELNSFFENEEQLNFTIKTIDKKKITTFFSGVAKPIVNKYDFIKGYEEGSLDFYSINSKNISNSKLKIYDFKLKQLPALTKLLTLASLQGIADLLSGEGIRFSEFEMNFETNKNLMTINEIYAIGPAISILMEGYIEKNKLVSLRGTLVPATTINKAIGSIPILGDILVGKKTGEGVFGVSFKIKGSPKNLETTVNPIKTLTPRFITRTLEKIKKN